jgi:hypothetical protein
MTYRQRRWLFLLPVLALGYAFAITQRRWLPLALRPAALSVVVIALMVGYFFAVRPPAPAALSRWLCAVAGTAVALIVLVQHVIIRLDISWRAPIVLAITLASPFVAGWIYAHCRPRGPA